MKRFFLAIVAAGALALAGCNAADVAGQINSGSKAVNDKVETVRGIAKQVCAYVPTVATVISIFNSGFGGDAAMVANAICNAVTTAPLADGPGDRVPRVNGVVIKGKFVR